eukprot:TRINITY_DN7328_c0_g1_i3.p2 TRINITY_DN7328_c0_g1~~TRINITY_DN7328_c0_g1_i3.p2  ORF type:complete len:282 (+),score=97.39 TRINITY_DN7328_c0_g1_i3:107-847(+)
MLCAFAAAVAATVPPHATARFTCPHWPAATLRQCASAVSARGAAAGGGGGRVPPWSAQSALLYCSSACDPLGRCLLRTALPSQRWQGLGWEDARQYCTSTCDPQGMCLQQAAGRFWTRYGAERYCGTAFDPFGLCLLRASRVFWTTTGAAGYCAAADDPYGLCILRHGAEACEAAARAGRRTCPSSVPPDAFAAAGEMEGGAGVQAALFALASAALCGTAVAVARVRAQPPDSDNPWTIAENYRSF